MASLTFGLSELWPSPKVRHVKLVTQQEQEEYIIIFWCCIIVAQVVGDYEFAANFHCHLVGSQLSLGP